MIQKININEKFSKFSEHWRPKTVAALNGQEFKLAKIKGEYPFHAHEGEDEMFFCWHGAFILDVERPPSVRGTDGMNAPKSASISVRADGVEIISTHVGEGEAIVVPKGVRHRPRAEEECHIFLIEPQGVKNNGDTDVDAKYDAPMGEWV